MAYAAEIICDSINPAGVALTTFVVTFPRFILAEVNTHRMLSRNSASSRAIPVEKMIKRVLDDPFIPARWPINEKGMQATGFWPDDSAEAKAARAEWLQGRDDAVIRARRFATDLKVHKQIANRLLEPFMWHTAIISATDWDNFLNLRDHKDAQPEFDVLAKMMRALLEDPKRVPRALDAGEWHLPFIDFNTEIEIEEMRRHGRVISVINLAQISCGRCARVSYLTHDGVRDIDEDIQLSRRLISTGHMSPFEHAAMASNHRGYEGNFCGFKQYRKFLPNEAVFPRFTNAAAE